MKTTSSYRKLVFIVITFCLISQNSVAKSIKSTSQGGNWHSASTWEGGVVPGKNDQVTIDSRVYLNTKLGDNDSCFSLTITKNGILESVPNTACVLTVINDFINAGTVINHVDHNFLLQLHGNIMNYNKIENVFMMPFLDDRINKVTGTFDSQFTFNSNSDSNDIYFLIEGKTSFKRVIQIGTSIVIDNNAEMTISVASLDGIFNPENKLKTNGIFNQQTIRNFQYTYFDTGGYLNLKFAGNQGECLYPKLITHGSRCHPRMKSSVARWWRLSAKNENKSDSIDPYILELTYDDALLNGIKETELQVYLSKDEGVTWKKISNAETMVRNTEDNKITIGSEQKPINAGGGDIVLAAGVDDVIIPSSISVSIIGPDQIRIGAPNHYRMAYWNNGTVNTGTFFVKVKLEGGIEIDKMISHYPGDNTPVEFKVEEINPYGDKTYGFFLIDGLGSKEYSSFDLILNCLPDTKSAKSTGEIQALPVIALVGLYLGAGLVVNYVSDVIAGSCYEMIFNDNTTVSDAAKSIYEGGIKKTNAKYTVATPVQTIGSTISTDLMALAGLALWPAELIKAFWDCINDIADGLNAANAKKNPTKVNAWDPNAKYGPSGFGDKNYTSKLDPMIYMIKFENLKEATAPAYKIIVKDTLNPEIFDVSTIEPMGMSHNKGIFSMKGNVLTWEFVAIELPPNKVPPEGEGWVSFKVNLKDNLKSGTQIKNSATITFDLNKPVKTNATINTLDFDAPATVPQDFPQVTSAKSVNLKWNSSDGTGSGVDLAYIYSSVNNGPYSLIGTSTGNEKKIDVNAGNDYRFFVLTKDNVGNVEAKPGKIVSTKVITAVEEIVKNEFVRIYPNPAKNSFTINVQMKTPEDIRISVFDILGRKILESYESVTGNNVFIPVTLVNPVPGLHLIKIKTGNTEYSEKIIIR